jgi:hypothetical protein
VEGHRGQYGPASDDTVTFDVTVSTDTPGTDDMAGIVQKLVDLVDVSPDFQVTIATRTYSHVERIMPTA